MADVWYSLAVVLYTTILFMVAFIMLTVALWSVACVNPAPIGETIGYWLGLC